MAYDAQLNRYYWIIEGGQSNVFEYNPISNSSMEIDTNGRLDNPASLKLDYIARRLFWVEDGITVSIVTVIILVKFCHVKRGSLN